MFRVVLVLLFLISNIFALDKLKVGVLAFGTVNWELDVIKNNKLDEKNGFQLEVVKLASKNATSIALQSKSVDVIVTDWIWVNTQRFNGIDFTFYPYSKANGTLYVGKNSSAKNLADLKGKQIGVSGGPFDKTWLIFRAYCKKKYGEDFKDFIEPTFAAPPILMEKVLDESLDGAINFWHFNAKAKAKGARALIDMDEVLSELGVNEEIAFIGWTFRRDKALENPKLYNSFLNASLEAKMILKESDNEWNRLKNQIMQVEDDETFEALKEGFQDGIIKDFSKKSIEDSKKVFDILVDIGGKKLLENSDKFDEKSFWEIKEKY